MSKFNPEDHMIKMSGKDYLEVKWRIVWFRGKHPNGTIETELLHFEEGMALVKAIVSVDGKMVATGIASADSRKKKAMWTGKEIMKAETAAIGRALSHAGFGTQFTGDEEGEYLADSPVESQPKTGKWPTDEHIKAIFEMYRAKGLSDADIMRLANVTAWNDYDGWNKYKTGKDAAAAIDANWDAELAAQHKAHLEKATNGTPEMSATFGYMAYDGKHSNLYFAVNDPIDDNPNNTVAVLFGGRSAIKKWNAELAAQLELSQYDTVKNKNIMTEFKRMFADVEFYYKPGKRGDSFEITGIKGVPEISF